ncbi:MAG: methylated-DNA--[protein]-cysteine S-methyltransferase [Deltaproteobacteria bacterium]|nr:MAG: methylated-DNA--[protein]-cysteine S-methyltransferase [Deltaproteobacteria bacterium]
MKRLVLRFSTIDTPIGIPFWFAASDEGFCRTTFRLSEEAFVAELEESFGAEARRDARGLEAARETFEAYFHGELRNFSLPIDLRGGTPFERRVWRGLQRIPYGKTWSYQEQARFVGHPRSVRAVGAANGKNPLPILLPCHRVIGSDGKLRGFRGGVEIKAWLLQLERQNAQTTHPFCTLDPHGVESGDGRPGWSPGRSKGRHGK